jgi:quercetin dioxygenase-like cupin family protein
MARSGEMIENPVTRERIRFLRTSQETTGELTEFEVIVEPRGFAAAEHVHPKQEERFEVLSGCLHSRVDGVVQVVLPGGSLVVPRGTPHVWRNGGNDELRMRVEFRPALKTESFFETFFGLARDGKTNPKNGLPGLLQVAVLVDEYRDEIRLIRPPWIVQRMVLFLLLVPVARLLGFRAQYPEYSARQGRSDSAGAQV